MSAWRCTTEARVPLAEADLTPGCGRMLTAGDPWSQGSGLLMARGALR